MEKTYTASRFSAIGAGAAILTASAAATILSGHLDTAHGALVIALAGGVLAGAATIGKAITQRRFGLAVAIGVSLFAGEAFNTLQSADRIVTEREASQAAITSALGAHEYALTEQAKAQKAFDRANEAATSEAAKPGCKVNCRELLQSQVTNAKADLDAARKLVAANPKPSASGSPLADRIGVPAWAIDLLTAALLALVANGLAAALIAFGAHGAPASGAAPSAQVVDATHAAPVSAPAPTSTPPAGKRGRRGATEKDGNLLSFVDAHIAKHGRAPTVAEVQAAHPGTPRTTAQRYIAHRVQLRAVA